MYEEKLKSKITVKGKEISYYQLLESEVQSYKNFLLRDESYKPYKYYWKKSVELQAKNIDFQKWRKIKENRYLRKNDRPTFSRKRLQKEVKSAIIKSKNSENTVVVPYL